MPYNDVISRTDADALIPVEQSNEILKALPEKSAVMSNARRLPNMSTKTHTQPVLSTLPTGYFVNADTGLKQTTDVTWAKKTITAEELAVIVPIPEAVLDDSQYPIWDEVKPLIVEEFGRIVDRAMLLGENKPASWPTDILAGAVAASQTVDLSTVEADSDDIFDALLGTSGTLSLLEADGYAANGHIAAMSMKAKLRGLRDSNGQPIFMRSLTNGQNAQGATRYELDGEPLQFPKNGSMDAAQALMFSGDWTQLVWTVRQDITWKIFSEGVIQDESGTIIYNLMQQDMVALRAVFRIGFQIANPINRLNSNDSTRYPFAVLVP